MTKKDKKPCVSLASKALIIFSRISFSYIVLTLSISIIFPIDLRAGVHPYGPERLIQSEIVEVVSFTAADMTNKEKESCALAKKDPTNMDYAQECAIAKQRVLKEQQNQTSSTTTGNPGQQGQSAIGVTPSTGTKSSNKYEGMTPQEIKYCMIYDVDPAADTGKQCEIAKTRLEMEKLKNNYSKLPPAEQEKIKRDTNSQCVIAGEKLSNLDSAKCNLQAEAIGYEEAKRFNPSGGGDITDLPGSLFNLAATAILDPIADGFGKSAADMLLKFQRKWVGEQSLSVSPQSQEVSYQIRSVVLPLAAAVLVAGLIWQGIVIILTRRSQPLVDLIRGLFTFAIWASLGVAGPVLAMRISDALALEFFNYTQRELAKANMGDNTTIIEGVAKAFAGENTNNADMATRLLLGPLLILTTFFLQFTLIFREMSVVILSGVIIVAAAGSVTGSTKQWLFKIISWMLALIAYKPLATLVYLAATLMYLAGSKAGASERQFYAGLVMIGMTVVMLPLTMRFFSWATSQGSGSGAGSAFSGMTTNFAQYGMNFRR